MKAAILKEIKNKIELNEKDYASAYIAKWVQLQSEEPVEEELTKADIMMQEAEKRIALLKKMEKLEAKSI
jgi:hypothetical protein